MPASSHLVTRLAAQRLFLIPRRPYLSQPRSWQIHGIKPIHQARSSKILRQNASHSAKSNAPGRGVQSIRLVFNAAALAAGIMFFKETICETHRVSGSSMAPTLSANFATTGEKDHIFVRKRRAASEAKRGDVVAFASPRHPEMVSIKRIVATGGDTVFPDGRYPQSEVLVPWGHVWVEGDNWRDSLDSNDYGPISRSLINGVAVYAYSKWGGNLRRIEDIPFKSKRNVIPGRATLPPSLAD